MPSTPEPRAYRMGARAESAALTRERVLDAAAACFGEQDYDAVSLREIAERAGVGLQTVVRTAGSKEALFAEVAERFLATMMAGFEPGRVDDWRSALRQLMTFYEAHGDQSIRVMAHEHRVPGVRQYVQRSRELQAAWLQARHGDAFAALTATEKKRRVAMVLTLTGGRTWYTLRREHGLSASETHRAIEEQLEALLALPA
ncbi:MAG: TetR/AcrR family transcriptional regulator [Sandaracinaceae bacterium]|nr:TetR/AcrR family transcriptional regulator [Sandaracinaceae bacterium]